MARDLLEPQGRSTYTIGSIVALDAHLTLEGDRAARPSDDIDRWDAMLDAVCPNWPGDDYQMLDHAFVAKAEGGQGVNTHLLTLYDHLRQADPSSPLFDRCASDESEPVEPCLPDQAGFSNRLAHSGSEYALAPAQRGALAHLLAARHGEIVVVNGPPGTGKTSLLLSVVATLWAKAALEEAEPPIIVAASTNNQAVTNIIDAFGKDFGEGTGPLAGRWLPRLASFGAFYPAASKQKAAAERYQTAAFFDEIETPEFLATAEAHYLLAAGEAFPQLGSPTVEASIAALHDALVHEVGRLREIEAAWRGRDLARSEAARLLGDDPAATLSSLRADRDEAEEQLDAVRGLAADWARHLAHEPLIHALLGWLPPIARRRRLLARLFLDERWPAQTPPPTWTNVTDIEPTLLQLQCEAERTRTQCSEAIDRAEIASHELDAAERRCEAALAGFETSGPVHDLTLADCDVLADRTVRFTIFLLTTHYWEGRWLLDMRRRPSAREPHRVETLEQLDLQWRRRLKVTPCVVSTLHTLPRHLSIGNRTGEGWTNSYLCDHVDLLIIDEAGQVAPEVAGACLALARRALVIGDTLQIEPIWSAQRDVDIGNLIQAGLLPPETADAAYDAIQATGKSSANGSVMAIAQNASRYHQEPELARGLMLTEHRRCFDEIIGYCNALCYHGKLQLLRGVKADTPASAGRDGLPAMGHLHIDGVCLQGSGGSRHNPTESDTIARWLVQNRERLESVYGLPLASIVGVVTPFGAQVRAIEEACRDAGVPLGNGGANRLTIGTVHALQGAQRPIILFSPVYSKHADGDFIDRSASMLNVAVSRAMNSFLVFGDMDVMAMAPSSTPRGRLSALLRTDDANALSFGPVRRRDLETRGAKLTQLQDAAEHDAFLAQAFEDAKESLLIVTPWIKLERIREIGALDAMRDAAARGVAVSVYTDRRINLEDGSGGPEQMRRVFERVKETFRQVGAALVLVEQVHSKVVIADEDTYCVGPFNWFSAQRTGPHVRAETSLVYRGRELDAEIKATRRTFERSAKLADRKLGRIARLG